MHDYLRAVGFSGVTSGKQLNELIEYVKDQADTRVITPVGSDRYFVQLNKYFTEDVGVSVIGEYDGDYSFYYDHIFPFINGRTITYEDSISIKKQSDKNAYIGYCDDYNFGSTLLFFLLNESDYVRSCWSNRPNSKNTDIRFSGLSYEGKILLGTRKTPEEYVRGKIWNEQKKRLLSALKKDNEDESLITAYTNWDIANYAVISKRAVKEDVFSIVESSFTPYSVEFDKYSIVGVITSIDLRTNNYSGEKIWVLTLECNDTKIDVCIGEKDLLGEPMVGRRFKGNIWLQGYVDMM